MRICGSADIAKSAVRIGAVISTVACGYIRKFEPDLKSFEIDDIEEQITNWNALKVKVIALIDQKFHVGKVYLVAMFLDPMFKPMVKESQESKNNIKQLTIELYKEFIEDNVNEEYSTGRSSNSLATSQGNSESSLFASFMTTRDPHRALASTIVILEKYSYDFGKILRNFRS